LDLQKINLCASAKSINIDLWHRRFGHPSDKVLNYILDCKNLNCTNCEVCKLAKQTKLPFSHSNSKSEAMFDLIHSDVDPSAVEAINGFDILLLLLIVFKATWLYSNQKMKF
jgi:hypothetical protein